MAIMCIKATRQNGLRATNLNYDTAHDAASGGTRAFFVQNDLDSYDSKYDVTRSFFYFDTSSLEGLSISASRLILWAIGIGEINSGHSDLHLVEGVQHIPLIGTDYGDELTKTTSGGTISPEDMLASYVAGIAAYVFALTLNATGRGWIVKDGNTKCCLRVSGDIDDMTPGGEPNLINMGTSGGYPGAATSDATSVILVSAILHGYHRGGTEDAPYLEVTYEGDTPGYPRVRFNYGKTTGYGENTDWQLGIAALTDFSAVVDDLDSHTTYHFRAEIEDAEGTDYGDDKEFVTSLIPTLLTNPCTERTLVALNANGDILSTGGANCTRRGFAYKKGTTGDPNIDDDSEVHEDGNYAEGDFLLAIAGLDSGEPYRVRAYAVNPIGTAYGGTVDSAVLVFNPTSRVSAIRRIFRPGVYRMEIALGDLGFEWDVAEAAMKKTDEGVGEPEKPKDVEPKPLKYPPDEVFVPDWMKPEVSTWDRYRALLEGTKDEQFVSLRPITDTPKVVAAVDVAKEVIGGIGMFISYVTHPGALVTDMIKKLIGWFK